MALGEQFAQEFVMSWWSAVPAIILLGLIFAKLDIKKSISISVLSALVLAFVLQERGIEEILNTLFSGYVSKNLSLSKMLNGGGFLSMVPVVIIICISCTYSGLFEGTALIDTLKNGVEKISKKST
ncbi:Na+/H+ antiporter NhaC family protein, partial [Turicimonas muris]